MAKFINPKIITLSVKRLGGKTPFVLAKFLKRSPAIRIIILDFKKVDRPDVSMVKNLISIYSTAKHDNTAIKVTNASDSVKKLLDFIIA